MFALVVSILICNVWQLASNKVTTIIITISFKNTKLWLKLGNLKCNFNAICWVILTSKFTNRFGLLTYHKKLVGVFIYILFVIISSNLLVLEN